MHVINIMSSEGGVGRTTLAALASIQLWYRHKRVMLVDLDMRAPCLHAYFVPEHEGSGTMQLLRDPGITVDSLLIDIAGNLRQKSLTQPPNGDAERMAPNSEVNEFLVHMPIPPSETPNTEFTAVFNSAKGPARDRMETFLQPKTKDALNKIREAARDYDYIVVDNHAMTTSAHSVLTGDDTSFVWMCRATPYSTEAFEHHMLRITEQASSEDDSSKISHLVVRNMAESVGEGNETNARLRSSEISTIKLPMDRNLRTLDHLRTIQFVDPRHMLATRYSNEVSRHLPE